MTEELEKLPAHIAIIMDGNGRWAQARGLPRSAGHRAGAEAVRTVVTECRGLGIRHLTLYAFSSENWNRPKSEISALFSLLLEFLRREVPLMEEKGIALKVLGDLEGLPLPQRTALRHAMGRTEAGREMTLNLALNYAGPNWCAPCEAFCATTRGPRTLPRRAWRNASTPPVSPIRTCSSAPAASSV